MNSPVNITLEAADSITVIIGLGANLPSGIGSPFETLKQAIEILKSEHSLLACSSFYQAEAVDCPPGSADFINAVIALRLDIDYSPGELLDFLKDLERKFGREDSAFPNTPRPLDLDILCFGRLVESSSRLTIPHPRASQRRFVMEPLAEIAPDLILPGETVSARKLLETLPLTPAVSRLP